MHSGGELERAYRNSIGSSTKMLVPAVHPVRKLLVPLGISRRFMMPVSN
jgi:hypothetical protein